MSFLSRCFFRSSPLRERGGVVRVQTWMVGVQLAHIKWCQSSSGSVVHFITQRTATPMHEIKIQKSNVLGSRCVASTIRVAQACSESSSGGSSNPPTSIHLKAKSICVKKEIPMEDRIWTIILGCPKCKRDSFETRISKCVSNMVRHHDQDERETDGASHWDGVLSVLKGKFRNQLEEEFTDED